MAKNTRKDWTVTEVADRFEEAFWSGEPLDKLHLASVSLDLLDYITKFRGRTSVCIRKWRDFLHFVIAWVCIMVLWLSKGKGYYRF